MPNTILSRKINAAQFILRLARGVLDAANAFYFVTNLLGYP
jgi:hypothetical protein